MDILLCAWQSLGYYQFICYSTTISFYKAFVLPCLYLSRGSEVPRVRKCPGWLKNSFENAQFYSETVHSVGSLISSSAACFVCLWEPWASLLVACVHLRGSLIRQVSEVAFTSILILNFPLQLTLPDWFLKYRCGLFCQPGGGQPLQTGRIWRLAIHSVLNTFLGLVFGAAEPLLDNVSLALFVSACVTDFNCAW